MDCFTQWKMMGEIEYVMGLEPGNCHPEGRAAMRENGRLKYIDGNSKANYWVEFEMFDSKTDWDTAIKHHLNK